MSTESLPAILAVEAFPKDIAGIPVRPLSAPSLAILQRTGNLLLQAKERGLTEESPELLQALQEFIYIHAADFAEVVRNSRLPHQEWEDFVMIWAVDKITVTALLAAQASFDVQLEAAEKKLVEPEDSPSAAPSPDPNA